MLFFFQVCKRQTWICILVWGLKIFNYLVRKDDYDIPLPPACQLGLNKKNDISYLKVKRLTLYSWNCDSADTLKKMSLMSDGIMILHFWISIFGVSWRVNNGNQILIASGYLARAVLSLAQLSPILSFHIPPWSYDYYHLPMLFNCTYFALSIWFFYTAFNF